MSLLKIAAEKLPASQRSSLETQRPGRELNPHPSTSVIKLFNIYKTKQCANFRHSLPETKRQLDFLKIKHEKVKTIS